MKLKPLGFLFLSLSFLVIMPVHAGKKLEEEFLYSLELFREGEFDRSGFLLQKVFENPESDELHGDALYWLSRCALARGDIEAASQLFDTYTREYPEDMNQGDAKYFMGRIFFLQNKYEETIQYYSHIQLKESEWEYSPLCMYWIGESLYALGRFNEASLIFQDALEKYPYSVKTEAIHYRLSLIEYQWREEELLKLLQWSHEEFLRNSQSISQKENKMTQLIADYEEKLQALEKARKSFEEKLKLLTLKEEALNLKSQMRSQEGRGGQ